jgi:hypothetical protein
MGKPNPQRMEVIIFHCDFSNEFFFGIKINCGLIKMIKKKSQKMRNETFLIRQNQR